MVSQGGLGYAAVTVRDLRNLHHQRSFRPPARARFGAGGGDSPICAHPTDPPVTTQKLRLSRGPSPCVLTGTCFLPLI